MQPTGEALRGCDHHSVVSSCWRQSLASTAGTAGSHTSHSVGVAVGTVTVVVVLVTGTAVTSAVSSAAVTEICHGSCTGHTVNTVGRTVAGQFTVLGGLGHCCRKVIVGARVGMLGVVF